MKILFTALLILLSTSLTASDDWLTNIEEAQEKAKAGRKVVLLFFTGSDWCPPCKAIKEEVLDTEEFMEYAKKNMILVELDFPRDKSKITKDQSAYNRAQAKKFNVTGFPTVIVIEIDGTVLVKRVGFRGKMTGESFAKGIEKIKNDGRKRGKPENKGKPGKKPISSSGPNPDAKGDGGKPDDGEKPMGPPNKVDKEGGKKTNREVLRKPGSKGGRKPSGEQGKKPDASDGNGTFDGGGKKPDGEQGGERPNWKKLLGLTDEQAKKFHAVMKKFREELEKINADKSLNPEKKMKARDSARKRRNAKLAQILTEEQMKKFRKIWRAKARPGNGPDGDREDGDSPCTPQQKAAMKKLMYWFSSQVKQILSSRLSEDEKNM